VTGLRHSGKSLAVELTSPDGTYSAPNSLASVSMSFCLTKRPHISTCRTRHCITLRRPNEWPKITEIAILSSVARCIVSYLDTDGFRHTVEVGAESLFKAGALAIRAFRQHHCEPGSLSQLEVERRTSVTHAVTPKKIQDWLDAGPRSPREFLLKELLKELLALWTTQLALALLDKRCCCVARERLCYVSDLPERRCCAAEAFVTEKRVSILFEVLYKQR